MRRHLPSFHSVPGGQRTAGASRDDDRGEAPDRSLALDEEGDAAPPAPPSDVTQYGYLPLVPGGHGAVDLSAPALEDGVAQFGGLPDVPGGQGYAISTASQALPRHASPCRHAQRPSTLRTMPPK